MTTFKYNRVILNLHQLQVMSFIRSLLSKKYILEFDIFGNVILKKLLCFVFVFFFYLTRRYQVKRVKKEKTEGLDEEHIVAVFPHQKERDARGTHGKIAKHL